MARTLVVQKFGGSSVASDEGRARVVEHVRRAIADGHAPILVVSALGRPPQPYATDSLIGLVAFAGGRTDRREMDMLMACGETISVVVMAHVLREAGIPAAALAGPDTGCATDGAHGEALILTVDPRPILDRVERGEVPVVAGFQGIAPDGSTTTLGRGGSDTSAVAVGVAVGAQTVEIYSDVAGVMTVDPRLYASAHLIPELSYEELGELAVEGAKVMHPRSVDLAGAHGIRLEICSTFSRVPGTTVRPDIPRDALEKQRIVTCLTPLAPVAFVVVHTDLHGDRDEVRCRVLETLAERGISLDLINVCQEDLYFMVKQERVEDVRQVLDAMSLAHSVRRNCAKLSVVGIGMRGTAGVMARIHRALHEAGVKLWHSTDSNITISCLIAQDDVAAAVAALHAEFTI